MLWSEQADQVYRGGELASGTTRAFAKCGTVGEILAKFAASYEFSVEVPELGLQARDIYWQDILGRKSESAEVCHVPVRLPPMSAKAPLWANRYRGDASITPNKMIVPNEQRNTPL